MKTQVDAFVTVFGGGGGSVSRAVILFQVKSATDMVIQLLDMPHGFLTTLFDS